MTSAMKPSVNGATRRSSDREKIKRLIGAYGLEELTAREPEDVWLIPGWITTTTTLVYGQASAGKSMFIAYVLDALHSGEKRLDFEPLHKGLTGLVICSDSDAEYEYKERLEKIGSLPDVDFVPLPTALDGETSQTLTSLAMHAYDYVVLDHATGLVEGDVNTREPWQKFYQEFVKRFDLPVIVVAHASDSSVPNMGMSHRPMGNSAITQFSRCEVEIFRHGNDKFNDNGPRTARSSSRYGGGREFQFRITDDGIHLEGEPGQTGQSSKEKKNRNRSSETRDRNAEIAELARRAPSSLGSKSGVARWVAGQLDKQGIHNQDGKAYAESTVRNTLIGMVNSSDSSLRWDEQVKKYV